MAQEFSLNRRGVALLLTLAAVLVLSAVAMTALAVAQLRLLSGSRQLATRVGMEAAEGSALRRMVTWDSSRVAVLPMGGRLGLPDMYHGGSLRTSDTITRLGSSLFLVRSTGQALTGDGRVLGRAGVARLVQVLPETVGLDSAGLRERERLLAKSRDNVAMVPPVAAVAGGWSWWH